MHYTVAVLTHTNPEVDETELEESLAPYNENLTVAPYVAETKEEIIEHAKSYVNQMKRVKEKEGGELTDFEKKALSCSTEEDYYMLFHDDYSQYDEKGGRISTYNPKSKWDWYSIGGRWSSEMFGGRNTIQLKDYPKPEFLDLTEEQAQERYSKEYDQYQKYIKDGSEMWKAGYYQKKFPRFKDYLYATADGKTYAILDENGIWHEPGEMGWFASSADVEDQIDFNKNYYQKYIAGKDPNLYITIVDCHI